MNNNTLIAHLAAIALCCEKREGLLLKSLVELQRFANGEGVPPPLFVPTPPFLTILLLWLLFTGIPFRGEGEARL